VVATAVAQAGYVNAGTVEMLLDADGRMWFMEMNTRLQVEHGVTEEITGVDLVEWQLRVAAGERLPESRRTCVRRGTPSSFRINAEDPDEDFRPCPGQVTAAARSRPGEGIRVDTHLLPGDRIPPNYDSMIAKLLVKGHRPRGLRWSGRDSAVDGVVVDGRDHQPRSCTAGSCDWGRSPAVEYDTTSLEATCVARGA
jgi:acetyl-CoA carboxylase biotin carboxylase subunit